LIFSGSIGRTDLPGGDYATIVDSLERTILTLPDHVSLHPGHGPSTTVAIERRFNPFLQGLRSRSAEENG
jgi:glyoxylase-like metal-dependent hydrolase (beta-lactamase superfamily II)